MGTRDVKARALPWLSRSLSIRCVSGAQLGGEVGDAGGDQGPVTVGGRVMGGDGAEFGGAGDEGGLQAEARGGGEVVIMGGGEHDGVGR